MNINDVLDKLSDDERSLLEGHIESEIDSELEGAVEDALRYYESESTNLKGPVDPWLQHNERGHAGLLSMCNEEPCIYA